MYLSKLLYSLPLAATLLLTLPFKSQASQAHSFDAAAKQTASPSATLQQEVHADMNFLADDELHGRGSATRDEHIAALFVASQLQSLGLEPGGDNGTFLQKSTLPVPLPARTQQRIAKFQDIPRKETWNAIAILRGTTSPNEVILLTAHLDHLGIGPANSSGDTNYNGADDDASGTTAVLTLAHILATGPHPKRTIVFALFGSEELGGFGNRAFLAHPPVPLTSIVANLEFEMIGRPDPAVPTGTLWLTGFDRSNLGPELAKHGAHLVNDPHPKENFFRRSDNYALAQQGIIAQTVSSYGLHKDYHQPSDEIRTIDFSHMTNAIASMINPIRWLADSDWKPEWNPGRRPDSNPTGPPPLNAHPPVS
ncbi:M28 family peptidase [Tunturibacter psychrotolerans]|uniref:M28 family peptidase n=1 Tax=Tunturiibacter psychrotolerans TaxID=3069686 RepID=A0AAU7ZVW0_9BACT